MIDNFAILQVEHIRLLSYVCGWLYFIIWSFSFYGHIVIIFRAKSAMGISSNGLFISVSGHLMYAVYNIYGIVMGNNSQTGKVQSSDILFSAHSLFAMGIMTFMFFYYPHQIIFSRFSKMYLSFQWGVFFVFGLFTYLEAQSQAQIQSNPLLPFDISGITSTKANQGLAISLFGLYELRFFTMLGYFKMLATILKHPPQVYRNYARKSTKGWSIQSMLMDFAGGFFALVQLVLEKYLNPALYINIAKLSLSLFSMGFDMCYFVQHFILYADERKQYQKIDQNTTNNIDNEKQKQKDVKNTDAGVIAQPSLKQAAKSS